jgi:hypothetical protein
MTASPGKTIRRTRAAAPELQIPPQHDWRTSDEDEIKRRRLRAQEEQPRIRNLDARHTIFSDFEVQSPSGLKYRVEIRDLRERQFACGCVDFRINGLGTCKHVEAVLLHLEARFRKAFAQALRDGSARIDIVADPLSNTVRVERGLERLAPALRKLFHQDGRLKADAPEEVVEQLRGLDLPALRLSQEIGPWLEALHQLNCAFATESRFPAPAEARDALAGPWNARWADSLLALHSFFENESADLAPALAALAGALQYGR